jgi:8-hydroxy-5-deazaflavin:NADPH oxidoreductase
MIMKIAFIGIGKVGFAIANNLQKKGHEILVGHNNPGSESVKKAIEKNPLFRLTDLQDAVNKSDLVFLATPYRENRSVLMGIIFNGKTLVDCTNPIGPGFSHTLNSVRSGSEEVQESAPDARVVKAFTIYGFENFADNSFPEYNVKPVMLIAGNDKKSKEEVSELVEQLGFFPKDTGALSQALHLEHMTLLWIKMVRQNGHHPNFVWAYLEK